MRIISLRLWVGRWVVGWCSTRTKVLDHCSCCYNYIIGHGPSPNHPSLAMSTTHRALLVAKTRRSEILLRSDRGLEL
jgi:hypothetical protein